MIATVVPSPSRGGRPSRAAVAAASSPVKGSGTPPTMVPHQCRPVYEHPSCVWFVPSAAPMSRRSRPVEVSQIVSITIVLARLAM